MKLRNQGQRRGPSVVVRHLTVQAEVEEKPSGHGLKGHRMALAGTVCAVTVGAAEFAKGGGRCLDHEAVELVDLYNGLLQEVGLFR